jgi:mRNA interferase MazF
MTTPLRGRVYRADIGTGLKPYLVVSNNGRNAATDSCLAARITTTRKPPLHTIIELAEGDPVTGRVLCDDVFKLYHDELREDLGALTPETMLRIGVGLRHALAL